MIDKIRRLIRSSNKADTTFLSFSDPLKQLCMIQNPDFILEFGPGHSTKIFIEHTAAKIQSMEENFWWFFKYILIYNKKRVHIIYRSPYKNVNFTPITSKKNPLIFIDGCDRLTVLRWAFNYISPDGTVYLHDAHREEYELGIRLFPYIFFPERHSAILCKRENIYQKIKENISVNYSCTCQYCSSCTRRAYFNQFSEKD